MDIYVTNEDRIKVYELCKTQLGGLWAQLNQEEIIIEPMT